MTCAQCFFKGHQVRREEPAHHALRCHRHVYALVCKCLLKEYHVIASSKPSPMHLWRYGGQLLFINQVKVVRARLAVQSSH